MTRKEFNYQVAISNINGNTIQIDFKRLSTIAVCAGFSDMDDPKKARECFIGDILDVISSGGGGELSPVLRTLRYQISVLCNAGWRGAWAKSKCVAIGGKGYVYACDVADPPGSKRQHYYPAKYERLEYGKAKILSVHS